MQDGANDSANGNYEDREDERRQIASAAENSSDDAVAEPGQATRAKHRSDGVACTRRGHYKYALAVFGSTNDTPSLRTAPRRMTVLMRLRCSGQAT